MGWFVGDGIDSFLSERRLERRLGGKGDERVDYHGRRYACRTLPSHLD